MTEAPIDLTTLSTPELWRTYYANPAPWRRGLPPGEYYPGMVDDFEVSFTIIGPKWHRRRTPEQKAIWAELKRRNKEACDAERPVRHRA